MWGLAWIAINVIGYALMGIDKRRAVLGQWRISEKALWICAACFGSFGIYAGMQKFRHKTKHWSFKIGIPCLMLIHLFIGCYFLEVIY